MNLSKRSFTLAALLIAVLGAGCSETYKDNSLKPEINVSSDRKKVATGESVWVTASTKNLAGAKEVRWTASPNTARLEPDANYANMRAKFSTDQAGGYVVTATAVTQNGATVSDSVSIDVSAPSH